MSATTARRSTGASAIPVLPDSARAISMSVAKVRRMASVSAIARSRAARWPCSSVGPSLSASSSRDLSRVSGLRRSCAHAVGHRAQAGHQRLDLVQHLVDRDREAVELVAHARNRQCAAKRSPRTMRWPVSRTASTRRSIRRLITSPPKRPRTNVMPSAPPRDSRIRSSKSARPRGSRPTSSRKPPGRTKVAGADAAVRLLAARARRRNLHPAGFGAGCLAWPGAEIASELAQSGIGEEVDAVRITIGAASLPDNGDQLANAPRPVLLGEAAHLGLDGVAGLAVDDANSGPVDEGEQQQNRGAEEDDVEEREPERGGPEQPSDRHESNTRRRARCGSAGGRIPCRSCRAADSHGRRSRWSGGRIGSPRHAPAASCASPPGPCGA